MTRGGATRGMRVRKRRGARARARVSLNYSVITPFPLDARRTRDTASRRRPAESAKTASATPFPTTVRNAISLSLFDLYRQRFIRLSNFAALPATFLPRRSAARIKISLLKNYFVVKSGMFFTGAPVCLDGIDIPVGGYCDAQQNLLNYTVDGRRTRIIFQKIYIPTRRRFRVGARIR